MNGIKFTIEKLTIEANQLLLHPKQSLSQHLFDINYYLYSQKVLHVAQILIQLTQVQANVKLCFQKLVKKMGQAAKSRPQQQSQQEQVRIPQGDQITNYLSNHKRIIQNNKFNQGDRNQLYKFLASREEKEKQNKSFLHDMNKIKTGILPQQKSIKCATNQREAQTGISWVNKLEIIQNGIQVFHQNQIKEHLGKFYKDNLSYQYLKEITDKQFNQNKILQSNLSKSKKAIIEKTTQSKKNKSVLNSSLIKKIDGQKFQHQSQDQQLPIVSSKKVTATISKKSSKQKSLKSQLNHKKQIRTNQQLLKNQGRSTFNNFSQTSSSKNNFKTQEDNKSLDTSLKNTQLNNEIKEHSQNSIQIVKNQQKQQKQITTDKRQAEYLKTTQKNINININITKTVQSDIQAQQQTRANKQLQNNVQKQNKIQSINYPENSKQKQQKVKYTLPLVKKPKVNNANKSQNKYEPHSQIIYQDEGQMSLQSLREGQVRLTEKNSYNFEQNQNQNKLRSSTYNKIQHEAKISLKSKFNIQNFNRSKIKAIQGKKQNLPAIFTSGKYQNESKIKNSKLSVSYHTNPLRKDTQKQDVIRSNKSGHQQSNAYSYSSIQSLKLRVNQLMSKQMVTPQQLQENDDKIMQMLSSYKIKCCNVNSENKNTLTEQEVKEVQICAKAMENIHKNICGKNCRHLQRFFAFMKVFKNHTKKQFKMSSYLINSPMIQ